MNSVLKFTFSAADRALIEASDGGATDLPPSHGGVRIGLAQNTSAAINRHEPGYVAGLNAGDFWLPIPGSDALTFKSDVGFACVPVAFTRKFVKWGPEIGGPPLDVLDEPPEDADWRIQPDGRKRFTTLDGCRVDQTISALLLVNGHGAIFEFKSTSYRTGADFHDRASHLRATVDGQEVWGFAVGKWKISSRLERSSRGAWFTPIVALLGRIGDPLGPSSDEWRAAVKARLAFKANMPWEAPDAIPAIAPPEPQMSRRRKAASDKTALPGDDDPDAAASDKIPF
jgi:hypothetical protein